MNQNKGLLSYIPFGVKLEKVHMKLSKTKGIVALCLFAVLIFQVINRVNTGKYFTMSQEWTKVFFLGIFVLFAGSFIFSLAYVWKFAHGWKVYVTLLMKLIGAIMLLLSIDAISPLNLSQENYFYFLAALLVNHALALIVHTIPLYCILSKYYSPKMKEHFGLKRKEDGDIKNLSFFLSPDYFYASLYKNHIKSPIYNKVESLPGSYETVKGGKLANIREEKNRIRYFVVFSNWINLMLTMLMVIYLLLIDLTVIINLSWNSFFFYLVLIRLVSRTFEVVYAFYKDIVRNKLVYYFKRYKSGTIYDQNVINDWRDSAIRKPERISLAVHSYIELILLFSMFYYILIGISFPPQCELGERVTYKENNHIAYCAPLRG